MLFSVLGPVEVRLDGSRVEFARKPTAVLAVLLLHANSWVGVDTIVDALWQDDAPVSAGRNVKTYVWQLRRLLPPAADGGPRIQSRQGAYRVVVEPSEVDALTFTELAAEGRRALSDGDPAGARERFAAALALWRSTPYQELPIDAARIAAAGLAERRWELLGRLAEALLALGESGEAVTLLRPLAAEEPLREGTWTALVSALHRSGRRSEALAAFRQARRLLHDELGVEPSADLREALRSVLADTGQDGPDRPAGPAAAAAPAPRAPHPALRRANSLPRGVPDFAGRGAERAVLRSLAEDGGPVRVAVVDGMAGSGKTALVVHLAHELAGAYPDAQLYVDLRGHAAAAAPVDPADALAGLLRTVGVPATDIPAGLDDRSALWRSLLAGRRVLLVLDDAAGAEQVVPLLPGDGASLVLVTSRVRLAAPDGVTGVSLGTLPERDAVRLLASAVGGGRVEREPGAAAEVVALCGHLPAAVRIAGSWLRRRTAWSVALFADWLREEPGRLTTLRADDRSLAAIFTGSCRALPPEARRMFRLLGLAARHDGAGEIDPVTAAALAGMLPAQAEAILEHLLDAHLLVQQVPGSYGLHPLVGQYARRLALAEEPPAERSSALARLTGHRPRPRLAARGRPA